MLPKPLSSNGSSRAHAIVGSALWAAAGDAVGWISELGDQKRLHARIGANQITAPVAWKRKLGRTGPTVTLPAGTYSDDTQLRLAVSRAVRGSGEFDIEAFAKVELPIWLAYSLGAGPGTLGAAENLLRTNVTWFSNFHGGGSPGRGYLRAGGNGAAMRIQPHVWKSNPSQPRSFVAEVFRDAVVTHGHPQGFCGAVFHALCVAYGLAEVEVPGPGEWLEFARQLDEISSIASQDQQLELFWRGSWETQFGASLVSAIRRESAAAVNLLAVVKDVVDSGPRDRYAEVLRVVGGFEDDTRGAGLNSAISAAALAWLYRDTSNEQALLAAANAISSDTDTIGTMAGAILGAARPTSPSWPIQDREYIELEATRLARVASGELVESFAYPDLMTWKGPGTRLDAVENEDDHLVLKGLGALEPFGNTWKMGSTEWQWARLAFGQSVLVRRRASGSMPQTLEGAPSTAVREPAPPRTYDKAESRSVGTRKRPNTLQPQLIQLHPERTAAEDSTRKPETIRDGRARLRSGTAPILVPVRDLTLAFEFYCVTLGVPFLKKTNTEVELEGGIVLARQDTIVRDQSGANVEILVSTPNVMDAYEKLSREARPVVSAARTDAIILLRELAKLQTRLAQRTTLESEFREAAESDERATGLEKDYASLEAAVGRERREAMEKKAINNRLKREMLELRAKMDELETAPTCPMCLQPIDETHRQTLRSEYARRGSALRDEFRVLENSYRTSEDLVARQEVKLDDLGREVAKRKVARRRLRLAGQALLELSNAELRVSDLRRQIAGFAEGDVAAFLCLDPDGNVVAVNALTAEKSDHN